MRKFPTAPISLIEEEPQAEQKSEEVQNEQKSKRRSKNDPEGRSYKCGCGKMYLSYPALYTHVKTKHDGINPEGTNAPQFKNGRGRGRPRKIKDTTEPVKEHVSHPSDNIRGNPNFADEISFLQEIGHYSEEGTDALAQFPSVYKSGEEKEHPLSECLRKGTVTVPKNCTQVLAYFLWEHSRVCGSSYYGFLTVFVCMLYKFLEEEVQEGFNEKQDCGEIPCYMNSFVSFLNSYNCEYDETQLNTLIKHFCEWLYAHGFTHIRLNNI